MERIEKTVFISYRRTNIPWALAIFQDLEKHGYDVFFDYDGIVSGDFERVILENIVERAHFLVLLTPSALERCVDPADWLRREIEVALDNRRNVVPLMLEGFGFNKPEIADPLTGKLSALKQYNGLTIPPEYFNEAMQRLRNRFLNVPLRAVRHPASAAAHKAATEQKAAAGAVPIVQERELTAQELFERGFAATDRDLQLHFYAEAIRLQPDSAAAFNIGELRHAAEQIRFRPFEDARTYVHTLGLRSQAEWRDFARNGNRPEDIPWTPERTYKKSGWKSWGDWLDTGTIATQNRVFRDFNEARSYIRNLGLDSQKAWSEYRYSGKKPPEIPANPARHYDGKG